jgi:hypothetical protein
VIHHCYNSGPTLLDRVENTKREAEQNLPSNALGNEGRRDRVPRHGDQRRLDFTQESGTEARAAIFVEGDRREKFGFR